MKKINRYKVSLVLNIIIVLLTVLSTIFMFTGFKFMHGVEPVLESTKLGAFKYFTVDSNVFAGIISFIFIFINIGVLKGKRKNISKKLYLLKLMATSGVTLTFAVVFLYLGHIAQGGIYSLLLNSNLFFHLIIPILNIVDFVLFIQFDDVLYRYAFYGLIPMGLYSIFYATNVILHINNGMVSPKYDWYWFVQNGIWTMIFVIPIIVSLNYIISLLLVLFNKKKKKFIEG